MAEAKHAFVDDYPYLVYTAEQGTLVYSDKANTSIDDIGGGDGQEYSIKCYSIASDDQLVPMQDVLAIGAWDESNLKWTASGEVVTKAKAGDVLVVAVLEIGSLSALLSEPSQSAIVYPIDGQGGMCVMPAHDVCAVVLR